MDRAEAISYWVCLHKTFAEQLEKEENPFGRMHLRTTLNALDMAITALREQEQREQGCGYCDIAKANEGVVNTSLWVKEAETNKWTMTGKRLEFCPMCGRKLKEGAEG